MQPRSCLSFMTIKDSLLLLLLLSRALILQALFSAVIIHIDQQGFRIKLDGKPLDTQKVLFHKNLRFKNYFCKLEMASLILSLKRWLCKCSHGSLKIVAKLI